MTAKIGRPAGEVHLALLQAAHALRAERAESGQGATLRELVKRACVGYKVAQKMVPALKKHGHLRKTGERRVTYRNRPVDEYAPTTGEDLFEVTFSSELDKCIASWKR